MLNLNFNLNLKGKKVAYYITFLLLLAALTSLALGGYLLIKAHFAQYLLIKTWQQQTVAGELKNNREVKPWPWADFYPVAKLSFERFNITQIVLNNDSGQALAFGPGINQIKGALIDRQSAGVVVISAHNDTHFSILKELRLNDRVKLTLKSGRTQVFKVDNIAIMDTQTEQLILINDDEQYDHNNDNKSLIKELVLVTCYPFNSVNDETKLRYIVYLS